ncbi:MAG: lysine--tRNA ligase, partial [Nitrospinota bacterium]|nr:lysine--tRNA ligase [Nitrospinota bacterium]
EAAQNASFQSAKDREINMKQWFGVLYRIFLGQDSGPRIGSFVALIGADKAIARLRAHLDGA